MKKYSLSLLLGFVAVATLTASPDMNTARMAHHIVALDNGRTALIGGHGSQFTSLASIEVLNAEQTAFTQIELPSPIDWGAVVKLTNGTILLAGGAADLGVAPGYKNVNFYDPATDTVTTGTAMNHGRMNAVGIQLSEGKVLVVGGWYDSTSATYAEVYDPALQTWTDTGPMGTPRTFPVVLPYQDGKALIVGGYYYYGSPNYTSVEIYDPVTNSFSTLSEQIVPEQTGWTTSNPTKIVQDMQLEDGRYYFLMNRVIDTVTEYAIGFYDPTTYSFSALPISEYLHDGNLPYGVCHTGNTLVVLIGHNTGDAANTTYQVLRLLPDNSAHDISAAVENPDYYMGSTGMMVRGSNLLITGGTTRIDFYYNFNPVNKTIFVPVEALVAGEVHYNGWLWVQLPYAFSFTANRWIFLWGDVYYTDLKTMETSVLKP